MEIKTILSSYLRRLEPEHHQELIDAIKIEKGKVVTNARQMQICAQGEIVFSHIREKYGYDEEKIREL